ncbi:hypothetical protein SAMN06269185_3322 [Natronoarchaeum philippinense]|uniref:Uncharacterized protein n=1 Tax=Natronoarchaeum philippinense TaxID=558529 RepID=A0A285P968_NATPI|nr:hypothetical protein [Natronoarchaeum philippinense]SNZ18290.1 hypothetical protein SAMN06269185_3322 [Natronoarchaeum philippinense]
MRETVMLDWRVPEREWQTFRDHVESEFGSIDGYLGREAERAMRAYADADGYDAVEQKIDRLVEAAGRRPGAASKEKNSSLADQPRTRVTARVDEAVKDEFRAVAAEDDDPFGVVFARAIREHREGGRADRLERKLDRVIDDAEAMLSELDESDSEGGLGKVDRNVITICQRLNRQFTDDELNSEIHDVAGRGQRASEPTLERYRELVIERLGVEPHPNASHVWLPEDEAAGLVPDGTPEECRKPVDHLDRDARARRIKLALGRRAANRSTGKVTARRPSIQEDILEDVPAKSTVLDLMEEVALADGFSIDRSRDKAALRVDLRAVGDADPDLFETIIDYRDAETDSLLGDTTETTVSDYTASTESTVSPDTASDRMDQLTESMTDGGGPSREQSEDGDRDV